MSTQPISKIEVKNVFKIFGNRAQEALTLVGQGKTKDQVLADTGTRARPRTRCWPTPAAWSA